MAKSRNDILWRFLADTKSLDRGNRKAQGGFKDTEKSAGRFDAALGGVTKAFAAVGGAYALSRVGDFITDATNMAAQAVEVARSFDTVFGPAADSLRTKLEDMRASVGLNSLEFESLLQQNGNLLRGFGLTEEAVGGMSEELFTAAADLAAFKGDTALTSEALHALNRALVGEFDPLEQFVGGVKASTIAAKALEMGLAETTGELTEQDKALALLEIVTSDASLATGAFALTQGTLTDETNRANVALEDAQIELGEKLTPLVLDGTIRLGEFASAMGVVADDTENVGSKFGALADAWDAFVRGWGPTFKEFREEIQLWRDRFDGAAEAVYRFIQSLKDIPTNLNPFSGWKVPKLPAGINLGRLFGRASGGPVTGNTPYVVGERGPEVMVPGRSGTVIPNSNLGGGGTTINVNFNGVVGDPVEVAGQIQDLIDLYGRTNGLP